MARRPGPPGSLKVYRCSPFTGCVLTVTHNKERILNTRDSIYRQIRSSLVSGEFSQNDLLIPSALGEKFNASRTPVREALALLEHDGLLTRETRGYRPRILTVEELLEVFEVRAVVESSAAAAAARKYGDVDLAHFERYLRGAGPAGDPSPVPGEPVGEERSEELTRADLNSWHEVVRNAAHNRTLVDVLSRLDAQIRVSAPWTLLSGTGDARPLASRVNEHMDITRAIMDRDASSARALMQQHLDRDQEARIGQLVGAGRRAHPVI